MGKFISNYNELPIQNKRIYDLVQLKSDGNVSTFAEMIGVTQQVLDRIFKKDKRSGKYPSVSESIKDGLKTRFGLDEVWLLTGKDEMLNTEIKPSSIIKNLHHSINNRVSKVINDYFNGSISEFCEKLSLSQVLVQSVIEFNTTPSYDILIAIIKDNSLNISAEWLMTGEGTQLKKIIEEAVDIPTSSGVAITTDEEYKDAKKKGFHLLPQVSFKFAAGQTQLLNTTEDITRYWYLPDCKDCEGVAQVVGSSMSPTLPSGCWVALKKYTLPSNNPNTIPFGNIFGVVVEDEATGEYHGHIKVLRRYKEQELSRQYWIAHSINSDEFDDFDIEIKRVKSLWVVKQHIVSDILL